MRRYESLRYGWRFLKTAEDDTCAAFDYDDSTWDTVRVPHDWAITGPFARENDLVKTAIIEDGQTKDFEHTARTGGLPHVGTAWYRKHLEIPESCRGQRVFIEFDGIMSHARIFLNGDFIGTWPYGYSSFSFELTSKLRFGAENVLAVQVDNPPQSSRWYPGAGIYRNARLLFTRPLHIGHWGVFITTPEVSADRASIRISTELVNQQEKQAEFELVTEVFKADGSLVAAIATSSSIGANGKDSLEQDVEIPAPELWSPADPCLYSAVIKIMQAETETDACKVEFGIRSLSFHPRNGFRINGTRLKLKGVCMHHDLGALGAAVNRRAIERQLEILQDMGCNAIRCSHNPPAPELLELCDKFGFLVIDEAFDEWQAPKCQNGYHHLFTEWAEKDLSAMIRRDRNHPCVIMWSIGNEVAEQKLEGGDKVAAFLRDICHREDNTRPVTSGISWALDSLKNGYAAVMDVQGWNYKQSFYGQFLDEHPDWCQYGSETESAVSSRGEYFFPPTTDAAAMKQANLQISSYDLHALSWGYQPDIEFAAQDAYPSILGEFVWTGFDYLGEPSPFYLEWPSRSSYFGIVDLCGFAKDRFYLYQSRWTNKPVLHLLPQWSWPERAGEITPVHCYTSFPAAELFLNGRSLGRRTKNINSKFNRYRLVWDDVRYEPGCLKVVALNEKDEPVAEKEIHTAGPAAALQLSADRSAIRADGDDLAFITVRVCDKDGNLCPRAADRVQFKLDGPGEIVAVDNGNPASIESFTAAQRQAFNGLCLAVIRTLPGTPGEIRLCAESEGLAPTEIRLESR